MTTAATDKAKGKMDQAVGKVKEKAGHHLGDDALKNKGKAQQIKGHVGEAKGKIKDTLNEDTDD
jgi:uncharacterized protein YjbJ (UPF0337 family)